VVLREEVSGPRLEEVAQEGVPGGRKGGAARDDLPDEYVNDLLGRVCRSEEGGRPREAIAILDAQLDAQLDELPATAKRNRSRMTSNKACILAEMGRVDEALQAAIAAYTIDPTWWQGWDTAGRIHGQAQRFVKAMHCYEDSGLPLDHTRPARACR